MYLLISLFAALIDSISREEWKFLIFKNLVLEEKLKMIGISGKFSNHCQILTMNSGVGKRKGDLFLPHPGMESPVFVNTPYTNGARMICGMNMI